MRRFLRAGVLGLDLVLLILFAGSCLAPYIHPRVIWWPQLVAIGLPVWTLLLLPAAVLVARARRWFLLALHVAGLLAAGLYLLPSPLSPPVPDAPALSLLTYNIRLQNPETPDDGSLGRWIGEVQPDIVALQEVSVTYMPAPRPPITRRSPAHLIDSLGYRSPGPGGEQIVYTAQPVFSRLTPVRQTFYRFRGSEGSDGPEGSEPVTSFVRTEFQWEGREAVLYNLHLRTFGRNKPWQGRPRRLLNPANWLPYLRQYREAFRIRAREAEYIRGLMDQETLPLLVCGDFNSTPFNWSYRHLARGLQDAFRVAGQGDGRTYHARLPMARIDYVLTGPEWAVHAARVPDVRFSDHRPLLVSLGWRYPG